MIKNYIEFLKENAQSDSSDLLNSIDAKKTLMGDEFGFDSEYFSIIENLIKDKNFLNKLDDKDLKKGNLEYTKDCETFLKDKTDIKFFMIFKKGDSELANPKYIVMQTKPKNSGKWNQIHMYEVNGNIRNFYDKLSSKTIEIKKNRKNYIYKTSNAGNDWTLQNIQNKNAEFKAIMSDEEISIISRRGADTEEIN
jgi:aspartyl-tRNA synthetase